MGTGAEVVSPESLWRFYLQPLLLHPGKWAGGGICRVSWQLLTLKQMLILGPHSCSLAFPGSGSGVVVVEGVLRGQRLMPFRVENLNILSRGSVGSPLELWAWQPQGVRHAEHSCHH